MILEIVPGHVSKTSQLLDIGATPSPRPVVSHQGLIEGLATPFLPLAASCKYVEVLVARFPFFVLLLLPNLLSLSRHGISPASAFV